MATRIVIADDHAVLREGLRALLQGEGFEVVGQAESGEEAIAACRRLEPDIVLLDLSMPGLGGLEAAAAIRRELPRVKIVVLTQHADREYVARLLRLGVAGYVLKRAAGSELVASLRAVARGGLALDPEIARQAMEAGTRGEDEGDPWSRLTQREREVLKLLAEGSSNKDVASVLGISVKTAMTHRENLMKKLGLHNRTELVKFAVRHGVVKL